MSQSTDRISAEALSNCQQMLLCLMDLRVMTDAICVLGDATGLTPDRSPQTTTRGAASTTLNTMVAAGNNSVSHRVFGPEPGADRSIRQLRIRPSPWGPGRA